MHGNRRYVKSAWIGVDRAACAPSAPALALACRPMDYRLYHAINTFVGQHAWLGRAFSQVETFGTVLLAVATVALWLLARPGRENRWKLASASALAAAAIALLVNRLIAALWNRDRPYEVHPAAHVWGGRSHDPSFPSDHTSAAFAIAFTVLFYDRLAGSLFVIAAAAIAVGRVLVGAHYPGDVLAGMLVGLGCAVLVARLARRALAVLVRLVERVTDPVVAPAWRLFGRR
jgi:undecaprenyl-diphosphatase